MMTSPFIILFLDFRCRRVTDTGEIKSFVCLEFLVDSIHDTYESRNKYAPNVLIDTRYYCVSFRNHLIFDLFSHCCVKHGEKIKQILYFHRTEDPCRYTKFVLFFRHFCACACAVCINMFSFAFFQPIHFHRRQFGSCFFGCLLYFFLLLFHFGWRCKTQLEM